VSLLFLIDYSRVFWSVRCCFRDKRLSVGIMTVKILVDESFTVFDRFDVLDDEESSALSFMG